MKQAPLLDVDPHVRRDGDFYPTPAWMTRALLKRLPNLRPLCILEPCSGDGAIVRELTSPHVVMNDIVERPPLLPDFLLDATQRSSWTAFRRFAPFDLVITNPPFDVGFDIAQHALEFAGRGVALLLRLTFLEPTELRGPWLQAHPPERLIVMPRHDFRGNGSTDSVTSAWMIWSKDQPLGPRGIDIVTKDERDDLIAQEVA